MCLLSIAGCTVQNGVAPVKTNSRPNSQLPSQATASQNANSSPKCSQPVKEKRLVLVNAFHKLPEDYQLNLTTAFGIQMDQAIASPYTSMWRAASKAGITLWISSGYRSEKAQETLFLREVEESLKKGITRRQAEMDAERSVARPGHSEHATGLTLDLNGVKQDFDKTEAFLWLNQYAQEYGFILRYPKEKQNLTKTRFEPWHYRYVGKDNAQIMRSKNLCLEEYISERQKIY